MCADFVHTKGTIEGPLQHFVNLSTETPHKRENPKHCPLEGHPRGHFTIFLPPRGHSFGQIIMGIFSVVMHYKRNTMTVMHYFFAVTQCITKQVTSQVTVFSVVGT